MVCEGDNEAGDGDGEEGEEFEEHEDVACPRGEFCRDAVESSDARESEEGDSFHNPYYRGACVGQGVGRGGSGREGANNIFAKDDGDDGCGAGLEDEDGAPGEEETEEIAEDFREIDLSSAVQWDGAAEFGVGRCTCPGKDAGYEPDDERGTWRTGICGNLSRRGEDAGANDEADDEREAVQVRDRFVFF